MESYKGVVFAKLRHTLGSDSIQGIPLDKPILATNHKGDFFTVSIHESSLPLEIGSKGSYFEAEIRDGKIKFIKKAKGFN